MRRRFPPVVDAPEWRVILEQLPESWWWPAPDGVGELVDALAEAHLTLAVYVVLYSDRVTRAAVLAAAEA